MNSSKIKRYFLKCLEYMPGNKADLEVNRIVFASFALSGLDIIGELNAVNSSEIIDWIYAHQVPYLAKDALDRCGFRGCLMVGSRSNNDENLLPYDSGHVTMTLTALSSLVVLGDDLSRVDRQSIAAGLRALQQEDGCFQASLLSPERDLRFTYSALGSAYLLDLLDGNSSSHTVCLDLDAVERHILSCQNYEGGFGQRQGNESHGGSTFCAIASLQLLGRPLTGERRDRLLTWIRWRQHRGFHGRPGKDDDSCYGFWIGATLRILGVYDTMVDSNRLCDFLLETEDRVLGGFCKFPGSAHADPMHSFLALCALSLSGLEEKTLGANLMPIRAPIIITERAHHHLEDIHKRWRTLSKLAV